MNNTRIAHPAPDKYREKWLSLNGEWEFSFDKPNFDKKINVPFSWTSPLSGINEKEKKGIGFYRKVVKYDFEDKLFIVFGGADYECSIIVNGNEIKSHKGGYCQFEVDVTDVWNKNTENEIIVKTVDFDCENQMYGKQGYGNIRGIWQSVWLEERSQSYIDKFKIITKITGDITFNISVSGEFEKIEIEVSDKIFEGIDSIINFKIDNPILWSPEQPYLYDCVLRLYTKSGIDVVNTYFGIREVGTRKIEGKRFITLNNEPIYINAALDQSFNKDGFFTFPDDNYCREEIMRAKELGLNALRIHIKTEEKLKLYWADKLGCLIIDDIPCFWGEPDETAKENFEREMYEIIDRDINHPSVFYWVIFNETWGLKNFDNDDKNKWKYTVDTQEWVRRIYHDVKNYDKTRLVEDNSPCNNDHVETDVNSWHLYINGYENMKKHCDFISEKFVEGSGENYIGENKMTDVPVMNSECGNYWGVIGNSGDSDISWQYKYMLNEFRLHDKICGFVFTELKDVINEFNGYYRLDDSKKYFGYENYNEFMTVKDLHSFDYLGFDFPPMKKCVPGENVAVPLFVSSFKSKFHGKKMKITWEVELESGINGRKQLENGTFNVQYNSYGTTFIDMLNVNMPDENGIVILKLYLKDEQDNLIMSNFVLFDVQKECEDVYSISLNNLKTKGFKRAWFVQEGNKFNCTGNGEILFNINKNDLNSNSDTIEILFEASSKEELTKDILDENDREDMLFDLMRGYVVDRGKNSNSFYMTDDEKYESNISVYVDNQLISEILLEDNPADTTGCLSWLYQAVDNRLDEAGSYGYICRIYIPVSIYKNLPETFEVKIKVENSISIFGRKSGRYPMGITIISK